MKILLVAGIVAVCIGAALIGLYLWSQNRALDKDGMVYVPDPADPAAPAVTELTITKSGDSLGCYYSWEIRLIAADKAEIVIVSQPTHSDPQKTSRAKVGIDVLERVSQLVETNGMTEWDSLPPAEIFALDAASTSVSFTYRGERHHFSDSQELPDGGWSAVREIQTLLEEAAKK